MHEEMYTFVSRFNNYIKNIPDDEFGDNPNVIMAVQELKFNVAEFMRNTGGDVDSADAFKKNTVVHKRTASELMSHYADAKAFLLAQNHHTTLEMGFVNLNSLRNRGSLHFNNLLHHDAKIRTMFAKDLEAQNIANGITHILDFGPTTGGGLGSFGRSGARSMGEKITLGIAKHIKKNKYTMEQQSMGYMAYALESHLLQGGGSDTLRQRAQGLLDMFDTADASLNAVNERRSIQFDGIKKTSATTAKALSDALFKTDHRLLRDQKVYEEVRNKFKPILEKIAKAPIREARGMVSEIVNAVDGKSQKYGRYLQGAFGYMQRVYQAQGQLIPKNEMPLETESTVIDPDNPGKGSWAGGNAHILNRPTVPIKWQRAFLTGKGVEARE